MNIKRDVQELYELFDEQYGFLTRSNESFDRGYEDESKRIAVTIRVLLHDTKISKSLLSQLGLKNKITYLSTSPGYDEKNPTTFMGLVYLRTSVGNKVASSKYVSFLDDCPWGFTSLNFSSWWNEIILKDKDNKTYTRKDIILFLANKEGGAHVDPVIDDKYQKLVKEYSAFGWELYAEGKDINMETNCVNTTVRQISYELITSIKNAESLFKNLVE